MRRSEIEDAHGPDVLERCGERHKPEQREQEGTPQGPLPHGNRAGEPDEREFEELAGPGLTDDYGTDAPDPEEHERRCGANGVGPV